MNAPARFDSLPRFATPLKAIESLKPSEPLYLVHPDKFAAAARQFLDGFPGDVLYAVKANPHPIALTNLWNAGIRHFDTASLGEIAKAGGVEMADAGVPQIGQRDRVRIGLHRIKHVAGKPVEELPRGGGELVGMHQIKRFGWLEAFNRLQRGGETRQGVETGRCVHGSPFAALLCGARKKGASERRP